MDGLRVARLAEALAPKEGTEMAERTVIVAAPEGLHARPASEFVALAKKQPVKVKIRLVDGELVDAASILKVMSLGADCGAEVILQAEGEGAEEALQALVELVESQGH